MKKIYCKPSITAVKINKYCSIICTSTVEVKRESYDEGNMIDLSRRSRFSTWEDYNEE